MRTHLSLYSVAAAAVLGQALAQAPPSLDGPTVAALLGQASIIDQERNKHLSALSAAESPEEQAEVQANLAEATERLNHVLLAAQARADGSPDLLLDVAAAAADLWRSEQVALDSARAAMKYSTEPSVRLHRVMARALHSVVSARWLDFALSEREDEKIALLNEAKVHAETALSLASTAADRVEVAQILLQLGQIVTELPGKEAEAHSYFEDALATAQSAGEANLVQYLRSLFRSAVDLERPEEAVQRFGALRERGGANIVDWESFATLLDSQERYAEAGETWAGAARIARIENPGSEYIHWCQAGGSYWLAEEHEDAALSALRRCIELGAIAEDAEDDLARSHQRISEVLFGRGVYDQSVVHARQAIALKPGDGWSFYYLAKSLNALGDDEGAAVAAQSAVRLTDGAYSFMHFEMGSAYFDLAQWDRAQLAFERAASMDERDWAAAYNVALCLRRQGFRYDAAKWFDEVLRRKPDHADREQILRSIQQLRH